MSVNENQHIINRKVILVQKGFTNASLARKIGVTPQALSQAILGITHSLRIHRAIATELGVSLVDCWPELYGETSNIKNDVNSASHNGNVKENTQSVN